MQGPAARLLKSQLCQRKNRSQACEQQVDRPKGKNADRKCNPISEKKNMNDACLKDNIETVNLDSAHL